MTTSPSPSAPPPGPTAPTPPGPTPAPVERKKPGPKPWASQEQWTFLEGGVPDYRTTQAVKGKKAAIAEFITEFLPRFWAVFPLEGKRTAALDRKRIKEWFQNHGKAKKPENTAHITDIFAKPRTRALKVEEVYSRKYYAEHIKPLVDARKEGTSSRGDVLKIIKETTKEVFETESEEVRSEVLQLTKDQVPLLSEGGDGVITPEMFAMAIAAAPDQINRFMAALSKATGWAMMTIIGGPDPWDNGKIGTYGFHVGEDEHGRNFGQAFPNFKATYLSPFTRFLRQVYPAEVRVARALRPDIDMTGSSSEKVEPAVEVEDSTEAEMNGGDAEELRPGEQRNEGNGVADDNVDAESGDTAVTTEEPSASKLPASPPAAELGDELPSHPVTPPPDAEFEEELVGQPTVANAGAGIDGDNSDEPSEEQQEKNSDSVELPEENVLSEKSPSSSAPAGTGSILSEHEEVEASGIRNHKHQCAQVKDGLTVTRTKRVHLGPASKEILTLAQHAELKGGIVAAPKVTKRKAKK